MRQSSERPEQVEVTGIRAIVRFMAVDRDHDRFGNAGFALDPRQPRAIVLIGDTATVDPRRIDMLPTVGFESRNWRVCAPARLRLIQLHHARIGRQCREDAVHRCFADPHDPSLWTKAGKIGLKPVIGLRHGRWRKGVSGPHCAGEQSDGEYRGSCHVRSPYSLKPIVA